MALRTCFCVAEKGLPVNLAFKGGLGRPDFFLLFRLKFLDVHGQNFVLSIEALLAARLPVPHAPALDS